MTTQYKHMLFGVFACACLGLVRQVAAENVQTWTSESSFSGPSHSSSSTATGAVTKTKGGISWETEKQGVVDGDKKWEATTTGSGAKTADGYEWSSTTKGATESGKDWTTTRDVDAVKNEDGTLTINRDAVVTTDSGKTITRESQTVVTKTEDGKTWTTTGTQTGPKGTATMSGSGSAAKTDEGVSVNASRQGTTAAGKTWQSTTTGSGTKTDTGRKYTATTLGATEGGSLLRQSKASGYEGRETWKSTKECELQKSGSGTASVKRKCSVETQPAVSGSSCNKSGSSGKKSGFFSKFKKSAPATKSCGK